MQPSNKPRPTPPRGRPQFFDVVRPGRTPASPNSRPVLASNHPPVQDSSMMKGAPAVPAGQPKVQPSVPSQPVPKATPPQMPPAAPVFVAPIIKPTNTMPAPQDVGQTAVDSQLSPEAMFHPDEPQPTQHDHQKHSIWGEVIAVLAIVLLIVIIINILVDADILNLPVPHTNFFDY